jgi:hypothetical protein
VGGKGTAMFDVNITAKCYSSKVKNVLPGQLVLYDNDLLLAINSSDAGYLFNYINEEKSIVLEKNTSLKIFKKLKCTKQL